MGRLQVNRQRVHRHRSAAASVAVAVLAVGGVSCGGDNGATGGDAASVPSTAPSTSSTTPAAAELKGASIMPESVPSPEIATAQLVAVRIGSHSGYDRVVFELNGAVPGYDIGYLDGPVIQDGSGDPIEVDGDYVLSVRLAPASGVIIGADELTETYVGPDRIQGDGAPVTEIVRSGDFEAQSTWAIGVDGERPFKVSTLDSPTRIIVDVAES